MCRNRTQSRLELYFCKKKKSRHCLAFSSGLFRHLDLGTIHFAVPGSSSNSIMCGAAVNCTVSLHCWHAQTCECVTSEL